MGISPDDCVFAVLPCTNYIFLTMDVQQIQGLLDQTKASFDDFKSTKAEASRIQAQEQALKLARALERPRDAILKLAFSVRPIS